MLTPLCARSWRASASSASGQRPSQTSRSALEPGATQSGFRSAISGDGGTVVTAEGALVADHARLRLAARARHGVLRDDGSLRPHGAEAKHRAATGRMPVTGPVLIIVAIPGHRMRMHRRPGIIIVLVRIHGPIGPMVALHSCVEGDRDRERRRHRREQVSDGDKPSPPFSSWLSQANHPCTRCLEP